MLDSVPEHALEVREDATRGPCLPLGILEDVVVLFLVFGGSLHDLIPPSEGKKVAV